MVAKIRMIDVYANPFHSLDLEGTPQAVVPVPGTRNFIGARRDRVRSAAERRAVFYFSGDKVTVPRTPEVMRAVLDGALIVADEAGAKACGLTSFCEPKKQLKAEQTAALARWRAITGDPNAKLADVPAKATPGDDDDEAASAGGVKVAPGVILQTSEGDR